jgi:hypothetical protein
MGLKIIKEDRAMKRSIFIFAILLLGILSTAVLAGTWNANLKIYVPSSGQVVFYEKAGCRGEPYMVLNIGEYRDFSNQAYMGSGNWHDKTSCIDVGPNTKITVYEHGNYGGGSKTFTSGCTSLCGDWWDNKISSCKIVPY